MSTRCITKFHQRWTDGSVTDESTVYKHSDGYPEGEFGMLAELERFFKAVEAQAPHDTRFGDASILAARWVVWLATDGDPLTFMENGLNFTGVRVLNEGSDFAYVYHVTCEPPMSENRPTVTWEES